MAMIGKKILYVDLNIRTLDYIDAFTNLNERLKN